MTFLNPLGLALAALAIPILLLYMLRLRRREAVVSSHFLWQRALKDYAANTPWQRLRRHLLLLLQLLALALLVVALARPALPGSTPSLGRVVVLLDASASMQTVEADGQTRWALALEQARQLVDELGVGDEMLLLRVGQTVDVLSDFTADRARLLAALEAAEVGFGLADWETAFTTAAASASAQPDTRIIILSDGSSGQLGEIVLPATVTQPRLILIGQRSDNVALGMLAIRDEPAGGRQIFAQVVNHGARPVTLSLTFRLDGVLWRSQEATIDGESLRSFTLSVAQPFETVQAALVVPPEQDALALDNVAFAAAPLRQSRRVLLVSAAPFSFVERVLSVLPGVQLVQGDPTRATLPVERYDAYVFEGYLPAVLPEADLLLVNPPRDTALFTRDGVRDLPREVQVVQPDHPLLPFVDLSALNLRQLSVIRSATLQPLVTMGGEPLLLAGERGTQQIALLPFALSDSDLPLQIAFPILMANLLEWFTPQTQLVRAGSLLPGDLLPLTPPLAATSMRVVDPLSASVMLAPDGLYMAALPGLYRVEAYQGEALLASQWVAVNLFDLESRIAPADGLILSGTPITPTEEQALSLRDVSPWVALLALLALLIEWGVYHRQMRVRRA
ncbi:MAG: BatA domain-containing protein [Anaerolinea sp.]